jgi:cytochrome b6-f complex iron-sulfur subunit
MENNCAGACESHEHKPQELSRKALLSGVAAVLSGIGLTTLGATAAEAASSYNTKVKATAIKVGAAKTVTVAGKSILITRPKSSTYRAFKRVCTHETYPLNTALVGGKIFCPNHQQEFDPNTGSPTGFGPANRALTKYTATVKNGYIYVTV